jgi:polysaccharide biosynthesis/export protein
MSKLVSGGAAPSVRRPAVLPALLGAALLVGGCAGTRGGPLPYDVQDFGPPDAPQAVVLGEDYRIAPLDTVRVSVFQVPDLTGDYQVDLLGNVALPLVGNVQAAGLTTDELQRRLVASYSARYLRNPDITVGIKESAQRHVTVDGAVAQPGVFPVTGPMTLMQAVAMARGTTDAANPRRVAIFRQIEGQRMAAAFDLVSIRRGEAEDPKIYRGDIVVVDGSNVKAIQREILQSLPLLAIFRPF